MDDGNVILTGFMGTGKSTVGRILAGRLDGFWVDTDALIELRHGPIPEIFARFGEPAFRRLEAQVADELAHWSGLVISTGGRLMLDPGNAQRLGSTGRVFCLTARPAEIVARIAASDSEDRPLLAGDDPERRITELLGERAAAYRQFEQVATDGLSAEEVAAELESRLEKPVQPSS